MRSLLLFLIDILNFIFLENEKTRADSRRAYLPVLIMVLGLSNVVAM